MSNTGPRLPGWQAFRDPPPDPVPLAATRPPLHTDALGMEAERAACPHGPWFFDSQSGTTCARCGAAQPGSWSARCRGGHR